MTTGNASPTAGAGTVTILSTTAAAKADVGKVCTISSNSATALTLAAGCLTVTPAAGTSWSYRINWRLDGTGTTTAAGTTTTFVDSTKTLFGTNSIVGLQIRFRPSNFVARVTAWNATTFTGTFSPARAAATPAGEDYLLEPAQVGVFRGTVTTGGANNTLTDTSQTWGTNALVGLLVRFTKATNAGNQDFVSRVTANTQNTLTFVAMPALVSANDTFEIDLDGNVTNNYALGGATPGFQSGTVVCGSCHDHYADSSSTTTTRDRAAATASCSAGRRATRPAPGATRRRCTAASGPRRASTTRGARASPATPATSRTARTTSTSSGSPS
jgi:hypothetical protein